MTDAVTIPGLAVVDGRELPKAFRKLLRPGETVTDTEGRDLTLPTHFYEIDSWKQARETEMAPNFGLYEFISIDVREADLLRSFPRYVPLALAHLAAHLALLRSTLGTYVHVAANGGYRSPTHHVGPEAEGRARRKADPPGSVRDRARGRVHGIDRRGARRAGAGFR